ncbi:hypothetical protein Tco_0971746 [Tanacetum coccineum]
MEAVMEILSPVLIVIIISLAMLLYPMIKLPDRDVFFILASTMPNTRDVDHHDTASYIPLYNRTGGFTGDERDIYKSLVYRLFHEGRVVLPDFLEDEPNLRPTFRAIGFDCLLDIDEQICPVFVLQFYKSFCLIRNRNETICVRFTIDNVKTILTLENFAQILIIPCEDVCLYSHE